MSRLNSFHLPPSNWPAATGDVVTLDGPEARHMGTVLRTATAQTVRLFDGQGHDGLFMVRESGKRRAILEAIELYEHPSPAKGVALAVGWGKSKRRNYLFEKTVELKGLGLFFWQAVRSQGTVPAQTKDSWTEKCIQAAKQCGNPFVPELRTLPGGLDELIIMAGAFDNVFVAWESEAITSALSPHMFATGRTLVVIGPEGGFEDREAERLIDAGFVPVTLGDSILRWETAAAYCLSLAMFGTQETS